MKITFGARRPVYIVLSALGMASVQLAAAQEPTVSVYIVARPDMRCDDVNRSWKVYNEHTYHSFQVTVRWHAVGTNKEKEEQFVLAPKSSRNVGCAPEVVIVAAEEMQF